MPQSPNPRVAAGLARTVECVVLDEDNGMLDAETNGRKSHLRAAGHATAWRGATS
jgi:hypothetical protein